jgi:hypothetical protein
MGLIMEKTNHTIPSRPVGAELFGKILIQINVCNDLFRKIVVLMDI